jgi:hypothetical protein
MLRVQRLQASSTLLDSAERILRSQQRAAATLESGMLRL